MGTIKIYPDSPLSKKETIKLAKSTGLDLIDYKSMYSLTKIGTKDRREALYEVKNLVMTASKVQVIAKGTSIWIYLTNAFGWFRSSPIVSCIKVKGGYQIETENSFYKLEKYKPKKRRKYAKSSVG
jgi:hypothetical protein